MLLLGPKRYVILGHSAIQPSNTNQVVPKGVRLVFMGKCGYYYSKNWHHANIFKNKGKTNNFLMSNNVQFYEPGTHYRNQVINMPKVNNKNLLHGLYRLPVNMVRRNRRKPYKNAKGKMMYPSRPINNKNNLSRGQESMTISSILNKVSKNGGGTVIGTFCRGYGNITHSNVANNANYRARYPKIVFGRAVEHKRNRATTINTNRGTKYLHPKGGIEKYKSLRPIGKRRNVMNAIKKAESVRPVPRPTGVKKKSFFGLFKRL